ncbi:MAG TPA: hypothetical protein VJ815_09575 [Acidimicrobiia bacterium]|nr:hypothetical protein [Acidimicrobiia bacterium]
MAGPIVYVSHFRIKPGHMDGWRKMVDEVLLTLDAGAPRTAFQHFYLDETGNSVSIVHIFPDAEAVDLHMEWASGHSRAALESLEPISFELYGKPTESFMAAMGDRASLLRIEPAHMAGFDRL